MRSSSRVAITSDPVFHVKARGPFQVTCNHSGFLLGYISRQRELVLVFDVFDSMFLQILGVEGQNPSGFCLMATRIFDSIPLPSVSLLEDKEPPAKRKTFSQEPRVPEPSQLTRIVSFCLLPHDMVH